MSPPTLDELRGWPVTVPLWPHAATVLRISRTVAYDLGRRDALPVPVLRVGRKVLVATAHLIALVDSATGPVATDPAVTATDIPSGQPLTLEIAS